MIENLDQNQIIFVVFIMALSAIPVGFMAGLFGIGGGLITVPVLFYIFNFIGVDQQFIMHLAVGTSFSIIIPTSIISTMTHMKYKAVDFKIVKTFGLFVILGVILGTLFAANLKTASLILFFSAMTMFFSIIFLTSKEKINPEKREINLFSRIILGFSSGQMCSTLGHNHPTLIEAVMRAGEKVIHHYKNENIFLEYFYKFSTYFAFLHLVL